MYYNIWNILKYMEYYYVWVVYKIIEVYTFNKYSKLTKIPKQYFQSYMILAKINILRDLPKKQQWKLRISVSGMYLEESKEAIYLRVIFNSVRGGSLRQ